MSESPVRRGAARFLPAALVVLLGAIVIQVGLAGASAFGAAGWPMHEMLGGLLMGWAALTLLVTVVARPGRNLVAVVTTTLVLVALQPMLAVMAQRANPWFGLLHAADVLPLFVLVAWALGTIVASARATARSTATAH